jgi:hypothetical protein
LDCTAVVWCVRAADRRKRRAQTLPSWIRSRTCPELSHERLETNTSMPHMTGATLSGPGEPRVRIPVKRFLACPFTLHRQPRSRGGVSHHPRYRAAGAPRCGRAVSHNRKLVH